VIVAAREVEHSATEHDVGECVRKGHFLDGLKPKIVRRKACAAIPFKVTHYR
jgi:hypothetical protein